MPPRSIGKRCLIVKKGGDASRFFRNQNELVYEDNMTAMVDSNFSRYDSTDAVITTSDVIYLFVNRDGAWKIKSAFVKGNLTLGR